MSHFCIILNWLIFYLQYEKIRIWKINISLMYLKFCINLHQINRKCIIVIKYLYCIFKILYKFIVDEY